MMRTSKIDMFRQVVQDGNHDAAVVLADMVVETMGYETPMFVLDYLDEQAEHHQAAALVTARSYFFRDSKTVHDRIALLKKATKGGDNLVAGSAYYLMANEMLAEDEDASVKEALTNAADLGNLNATVMLARGYADGNFGCDVDIEKAYGLLMQAYEADFAPAKVGLAELLLTKDIENVELNPLDLLFDAVEDGVEGAAEVLFALGAGVPPHQQMEEGGGAVKLSETVVPATPNRLLHLREAVLNEFNCEGSLAEEMVARWHGFDTWEELMDAVKVGPPQGRHDEDCNSEQLKARIQEQIKITEQHMDAPPRVLALIVDLLKPTSRSHPPSLRKLDALV